MSLETKISELTAAVQELTAVLRSHAANPATTTTSAQVVANPTPTISLELPPPAPESAPIEQPIVPDNLTVDDLRTAAQQLLTLKRLPEILRINKEHGIRRITDCPPEKFVAVHTALKDAIANVDRA